MSLIILFLYRWENFDIWTFCNFCFVWKGRENSRPCLALWSFTCLYAPYFSMHWNGWMHFLFCVGMFSSLRWQGIQHCMSTASLRLWFLVSKLPVVLFHLCCSLLLWVECSSSLFLWVRIHIRSLNLRPGRSSEACNRVFLADVFLKTTV